MKVIRFLMLCFIFVPGVLLSVMLPVMLPDLVAAQDQADMDEYYRLEAIPTPENIAMEGTGLVTLPDSRIAVATRRGEIWILQNPYMDDGEMPRYTRFAHGLHEPVGLEYKDGAFYLAQRGELTRVRDLDGDGVADSYETVTTWPQSGNHHAFSFGPKLLPDGRLWVTLGLDSPFGGQTRTSSHVLWRGWTGAVTEDGTFEPLATGLKQATGFGLNAEGEMFFAEHDGHWIGSGYLSHVEKGSFHGHPAGLRWKDHPDSPVNIDLTPQSVPDIGLPMFEVAEDYEMWKIPAVWLPHGTEVGQGAQNDILLDNTGGQFGPYQDQLFISDHTDLALLRVFLEEIEGEWQGAAFPFFRGLFSGPVGQTWGRDGSMFIGMTDRGWTAGGGSQPHGLQRVTWTGKVPFEMKAIRAMPDGFELEFTRPGDPELLSDPSLYEIRSFIYLYRSSYASPIIRDEVNPVRGVKVSDDGLRVRLVVDDLREHFIHEIRLGSLTDREGVPLLHDVAYYTLNTIPEGEKLDDSELVLAEPEAAGAVEGSGTARSGEVSMTADEEVTGRVTDMPDSWSTGPDVEITLVAVPGLQFNLESFEVPVGSRVQFTLNNEDDMIHNAVIVAPETADDVGSAAMRIGPAAMQQFYVPEMDEVLYYTSLLNEGQSESIYFTAPAEPGDYQFVCTVPGHHLLMRGIMRVR